MMGLKTEVKSLLSQKIPSENQSLFNEIEEWMSQDRGEFLVKGSSSPVINKSQIRQQQLDHIEKRFAPDIEALKKYIEDKGLSGKDQPMEFNRL